MKNRNLNALLERARNIKDESENLYKGFRPWIAYSEKDGYTVTVYCDDFINLINNTLTADAELVGYLEAHTIAKGNFKTAEEVKAFLDDVIKGRKPCFINGEYDKEENKEKLLKALRLSGYAVL